MRVLSNVREPFLSVKVREICSYRIRIFVPFNTATKIFRTVPKNKPFRKSQFKISRFVMQEKCSSGLVDFMSIFRIGVNSASKTPFLE